MESVRTPPGSPKQQTAFEVYDSNTMKPVKRFPHGLLERMTAVFNAPATSPSTSIVVIETSWNPIMQATLQKLQHEFRNRIRITHLIK